MLKYSSFILATILSLPSSFAGNFIVKLTASAGQESNPFLQENGTESVTSYRQIETQSGAFAIVSSNMNLESFQQAFGAHESILYIENNEIDAQLFGNYLPKDTQYSSQWGLTGTHGIESEKVWQQQRGSKDLVVAVVDSGIDLSHEDLVSNLWVNEAEAKGTTGVDDDGNGIIDDIHGYNAFANNGNPDDGNGHGTHCAGVIGAAHNSIGVAGILKDVQLMAVKIFSDSGKTTVEAVVRGIDYAIKNGAQVMSNSWGGTTKSQAISDAVKVANDAGITFVAAAGNGNWLGWGYDIDRSPVYPAAYEFDNVISVGSITSSGGKSGFSNFGKKNVDLFAPGSAVLSTYKSGGYKNLSGTSMATPHVSGVVGLIYSEFPGIDMAEAKERLLNGVRKTSRFSTNSVSGGILNAPGAIGL